MKKTTIILSILLCFNIAIYSQSELQGDIKLIRQSQVDSFHVIYPKHAVIDGSVIIRGDNISNLNGLRFIQFIKGNLEIIHNKVLIDLAGLDNIISIGGKLSFRDNDAITILNGLSNLQSIGGDLHVYFNDVLLSLDGLDNIIIIGGTIWIGNNPSLLSLESLNNLVPDSINGWNIHDNKSLSTCNELSLCDYYKLYPGKTIIKNNAKGCNTLIEFKHACNIDMLDDCLKEYKFHRKRKIIGITLTAVGLAANLSGIYICLHNEPDLGIHFFSNESSNIDNGNFYAGLMLITCGALIHPFGIKLWVAEAKYQREYKERIRMHTSDVSIRVNSNGVGLRYRF